MLNKNHSISVRLSAEDYAFLMAIDQNGAVTQSDKVRELIALAKTSAQPRDFLQNYIHSQSAMAEVKGRYIEISEERITSVELILDFLAEALAQIESTSMDENTGANLQRKLIPLLKKCSSDISKFQDTPSSTTGCP